MQSSVLKLRVMHVRKTADFAVYARRHRRIQVCGSKVPQPFDLPPASDRKNSGAPHILLNPQRSAFRHDP